VQAPALRTLWLEGNPLTLEAMADLLAALPSSGLSALGLDEAQLQGAPAALLDAALASGKLRVSAGPQAGGGHGYFKLERAPTAAAAAAGADAPPPAAEVLVVSFGSAPGTPNWGGLLRKVREAAETPAEQDFDVLYVVDPHRSWYGGELAAPVEEGARPGPGLGWALAHACGRGLEASREPAKPSSKTTEAPRIPHRGTPQLLPPRWPFPGAHSFTHLLGSHDSCSTCAPAPPSPPGGDEGYEHYERRLAAACAPYRHVIFIGDSMGASGALLFAHLATEVHAWTPQVDLATSSIRWAGGRRGGRRSRGAAAAAGSGAPGLLHVDACHATPDGKLHADSLCTPFSPNCLHPPSPNSPGEDASWHATLKRRVLENVAACGGTVVVHTGSWRHDLDQARCLPSQEGIKMQVCVCVCGGGGGGIASGFLCVCVRGGGDLGRGLYDWAA
jgi:hypothetical protein